MKDETSMIVTCPACKSRHIRVGDTDYCEDCPTTAAGLKPHEVMDALRLPQMVMVFAGPDDEDSYDPCYDQQNHDDFIGWDIGAQ